MTRVPSVLLAAVSLFAITTIATTAAAQEEPTPPPPPPFASSGSVELELIDQSFDLAPNGDIELAYRKIGRAHV